MHPFHHVGLAFLALWPAPVRPDLTSMELTWPPPQRERDIVVNRTIVSPEDIESDGNFPCRLIPVPENVQRTPFPVEGGRIQLNLTSTIWGPDLDPIDRELVGEWRADMFLGQFRGLGVGSSGVKQMLGYPFWNRTQFEVEEWCSDPLEVLHNSRGESRLQEPDFSFVDIEPGEVDLDGVEATLGMYFVHFTPDGPGARTRDTETILTQCAYIRFTSNPSDRGPCSAASRSDPLDPSSPSGTSTPGSDSEETGSPTDDDTDERTATSSSTPGIAPGSGSDGSDSNDDGSSSSNNTIAIAAGTTSGIAIILFIIIVFLLIRRRRRTKRAALLQPMPSSPNNDEKKKKKKKKAPLEKEVPSIIIIDDDEKEKVSPDCDLIMAQKAIAESGGQTTTSKGGKKKMDADGTESVGEGSGSSSSGASTYSEPLPKYEEKTKE